jgi:hypothetical protein
MGSIAIAHTGRSTLHSKNNRAGKPNGVISNSHILSGWNGKSKTQRRKIRRVEKMMWKREIASA